MRTLILSLLISIAAFAQCGPNGQLVTIGGNKVCRPKSTLLDCPGGTCAIGATVHSSATSEPACDASHRGWIVRVEGGAGVSDTYRQCIKGAADTYAWTAFGSGGDSSCPKYTIAFNNAALNVASTTANALAFSLQAREKIEGITVQEQTQFAGTGITKLTLSLGRTGTETEYLAAWDLLQIPSATNIKDVGGHFSATMDAHDVQARFTATGGNLSALTAGTVDLWVCIRKLQ